MQESKTASILSAEVFTIPVDEDRYIIYAPLRRAAFVTNRRTVNLLADLKEGRWEDAADPDGALLELLGRLQIVDAGAETPPVTTFQGEPMPTSVTLFLTTACNLRCTYCYASAGDTPLKSMPLETALRGIRYVAHNALRSGAGKFTVAYHGGGEPTANWDVMTQSHECGRAIARDEGLSFEAASATNGVLRESQIDWMVEHLTDASVSFDGLPEVQDRHRITVDGKGSSGRVMHTLRRFDAARFRYGIRVTVTRDQIERLPDSVEFLCRNFQPHGIQVEPAYQIGRWADAPSAETQEFLAAYREARQRAAARGFEIRYSGARLDTLTNHFCGITQDSFALSPDGNVSACYEVFSEDNPFARTFFYGKPDEEAGYVFDRGVLDHLRKQAVQHRDYCRGCFAKWHCAGDCYHKSLTVNGPGEFKGSDRCNITRELTKDQILERIRAAGGLFWHEPPFDEEENAP